ncbi:MAG: VanZ family protein [Anaerolineae bacterium]|nr:VanZ family protein [Anaerolineae bacterium]
MFTPYLISIRASVLLFPVVAMLVLIPLCIVHYRRFGYVQRGRTLVFYSFLFFMITAFFLTLLPLPEVTNNFCEVHRNAANPRLTPFLFVRDTLNEAARNPDGITLISLFTNAAFFQAFFNFLLLLPLGVYLRYYFRRSFWQTALIAFGVTLIFELTQLTGVYGIYPCPYRFFEVDDLILNTTGALVGYWLTPRIPFLPDLDYRKTIDTQAPVSFGRRLVAFLLDMLMVGLITGILFSILFGIEYGPDNEFALDMIGYSLWFIGIPLLTRGFTPGKWLVRIKLKNLDDTSVDRWRVIVRYAVLLLIPNLINQLLDETPLLAPEVSLALLAGLLAAQVIYFALFPIFRKDRLGLHELISGARNDNTWKPSPEPEYSGA